MIPNQNLMPALYLAKICTTDTKKEDKIPINIQY